MRATAAIVDLPGLFSIYLNQQLNQASPLPNQNAFVVLLNQEISSNRLSVAIALAITWREYILYNIIRDFEEHGVKVLYCDTDSIIADGQMPKEIIRKYNPESSLTKVQRMNY